MPITRILGKLRNRSAPEYTMAIVAAGKRIECRLLIFDLTDTLIDSSPRFLELAKSRIKALSETVGEYAAENWARLSGVDTKDWTIDPQGPLHRAPRREDLIVASTAIYRQGLTWEEAKQLARKSYDDADHNLDEKYIPAVFESIDDALTSLREKGLMLAVATNDRREVAEKLLRSTGIHALFRTIVGADEVDRVKPAPDMILVACSRVGVDPMDAVFFGDSPIDMAAGKSAGVKSVIAVSPAIEPSRELLDSADVYVKSVSDIKPA